MPPVQVWDASMLVGSNFFLVAEMEVYEVDPMPEHDAPPKAEWRSAFR